MKTKDQPRKLNFNDIILWFYALGCLFVQTYLIYRSVERCKIYNKEKWPDEKPLIELYSYISLIVISVMLMPFLVVSACFPVSNLSNDGHKLGVLDYYVEDRTPNEKRSRCMTFWRHLPPICHICHAASAFSLMFPKTFLQAREIKGQLLPDTYIWNHEFNNDVLYDGGFNKYSSNLTLSSSSSSSSSIINEIRPEFLNYIIAIFLLNARYASVFWKCQKSFSFIFAIQLFISQIEHVISYCAFQVLYKLTLNKQQEDLSKAVGASLPLNWIIVLVLYFVSLFVLTYMLNLSFDYGIERFTVQRDLALKSVGWKCVEKRNREACCCRGYSLHCLSMVTLFLLIASKAPIVYQLVIVFKWKNDYFLLTSIILQILVFVMFVFVWFIFTVKSKWSFVILLPVQNLRSTVISSAYNERSSNNNDTQNGIVSPIIDEIERDETPDTTIKRQYRNSLRSKCDQFYTSNNKSSSSTPNSSYIVKKNCKTQSPTIPQMADRQQLPILRLSASKTVGFKIKKNDSAISSSVDSGSNGSFIVDNVMCSQV